MHTRKRNRIPLNFVTRKHSKLNVSKEIVDVVMQKNVEQKYDHSQLDVDDGCHVADVITEESESSHTKRITKVDEKWEEVNSRVYHTIVEGFSFGSFSCISCGNPAKVRCIQCGPLARYCPDCGVKRHSMINFHHCPEHWQVVIVFIVCMLLATSNLLE